VSKALGLSKALGRNANSDVANSSSSINAAIESPRPHAILDTIWLGVGSLADTSSKKRPFPKNAAIMASIGGRSAVDPTEHFVRKDPVPATGLTVLVEPPKPTLE
jgi:hypothetical protein